MQRPSNTRLVTDLSRYRKALLTELAREINVPGDSGKIGSGRERSRAHDCRFRLRSLQGCPDACPRFAVVAAEVPKTGECRNEPQLRLALTDGVEPRVRGAQIFVIRFKRSHRESFLLVRVATPLGHRRVMIGMRLRDRVKLAVLAQPLLPVLADRFEQPKARVAVRVWALPQETLIDQILKPVE